jgi:hypothetical protein
LFQCEDSMSEIAQTAPQGLKSDNNLCDISMP